MLFNALLNSISKPNVDRSSILNRKMMYKVFGVLFLLGVSILFSYLQMDSLIKVVKSSGTIINLSGSERMLSQKAALITFRMAYAKDEKSKQQLKESLKSTAHLLAYRQAYLENENRNPLLEDPDIQKLYFGSPGGVHNCLKEYLDNLKTIEQMPLEQVVPTAPPIKSLLQPEKSEHLLGLLDQAVSLYEQINTQNIRLYGILAISVLPISLAVLFMATLYVFWPILGALYRYEKQLAENEQKLRLAQEAAEEGVWEVDLENNRLMGNAVFYDHFGIYPQDEQDLSFMDFQFWREKCHPEDYSMVEEKFINHLQGHSVDIYVESRVKHQFGHWIWIRLQGKITAWSDEHPSKPKVISGLSKDVTTRKVHEAELQLLEYCFEQVNDPLYLIDSSGKLIKVNQAACAHLEYSPIELLSLHKYDFMIPKEDSGQSSSEFKSKQAWEQLWMKAKAEGTVFFETIHKTQSGELIPAEIRGNLVNFQGSEVLFVICRDISERKHWEKALKKSQEKFEAIFNNAHSFMGLLSPEGIVLEANKTALDFAGVTLEEVEGQFFFNTPWWEPGSFGRKLLIEALEKSRQGHQVRFETVHVSPAGNDVAVDFILTPIYDESGNIVYLLPEGRDITAVKLNEHQLQQSELKIALAQQSSTFKTKLLGRVSHEMRTPLNGIMGFSQLALMEPLADNPLMKEYLDGIMGSSQTLLTLINDLLASASIEAGRFELKPSLFELTPLVNEVYRITQNIIREKDIVLELSMPQGPDYRLYGDVVRIKQILLNLLSNASKYTDKGGIHLGVEILKETTDQVLISLKVTDTGIGIPGEKINSIFKEFEQVDSSLNRKHSGTGLGLHITKSLVEQMNGAIEVTSTMGLGSTFQVILPLPKQENDVTEKNLSPATPIPQKKASQSMSVLLVEDILINQKVAGQMIHKMGHHVIFANNGEEAIEIFKKERPDLILMDIQMPVMDGLQATSVIRQLEKKGSGFASSGLSSRVPIVALTAQAAEEEKKECLLVGMDGFLTKPLHMTELEDLIRGLQLKNQSTTRTI
ncbi:MAG: PAS domain S-box protein [Cyanobacteria bacterium]|nr:PAS domain S-box protein [Cyanobacteriota bacterium]